MSADPTTVGVAVATATVVVSGLIAMQICGKKEKTKTPAARPVQKEPKPQATQKRVSEKKKAGSAKKAEKERARKERIRAEKAAAEKAAKEAAEKAAAEEAAAKKRSSSKKKKKKKGKGGGEESPAAAADESAKSSGKGKKNKKKAQAASGEDAADDAADDGWAVVEDVKKKRGSSKKAAKAAAAQAAAADEGADGGKDAGPPTVSEEIDLGSKVPAVLGRGGSVIRGITEQSGARLDLAKGTTLMTVSGAAEQVAAAMSMIRAILDGSNQPKPLHSIPLGSKVPAVIGRGGSNIRRIEAESGASLNVTKDEKSGDTVCLITGEPEAAQKAADLVALYMANGGPPPDATETVDLGSQRGVTILIGKAGATIRGLQETTGARLAVARPGTEVVCSGTKEQVAAAVAAVKQLLEDNDQKAVVDLSAERGLTGAVMGKGGKTVQAIQQESGARLDIKRDPTEGTSVVVITGTRKAVAQAKAAVEAIVAAETGPPAVAEGHELETLQLGGAVKMVIGSGGRTLDKIKAESKAEITIRTLKSGAVAYVHGEKEAVEKATAAVKKVLENWEKQEKARAEARTKADEESSNWADSADIAAEVGGKATPAVDPGAGPAADAGGDNSWGAVDSASGW